jgi:preprotein translocase subunit YajC
MSPVLHAFFAQAAEGQAAQQNPVSAFLPFVLIALVFYFVFFRPQQKQAKQHKAMIESTQKGDEIVTHAGFYATVVSVEDPLTIDLGGGTKVRMVKSQIARNVSAERRVAETKTEAKK